MEPARSIQPLSDSSFFETCPRIVSENAYPILLMLPVPVLLPSGNLLTIENGSAFITVDDHSYFVESEMDDFKDLDDKMSSL